MIEVRREKDNLRYFPNRFPILENRTAELDIALASFHTRLRGLHRGYSRNEGPGTLLKIQ
jgi:hypothetical protein